MSWGRSILWIAPNFVYRSDLWLRWWGVRAGLSDSNERDRGICCREPMLKVGTGSAETMPSPSPVWPIPTPVGPPCDLAGGRRLWACSASSFAWASSKLLSLADVALLFSSLLIRPRVGPPVLATSPLPNSSSLSLEQHSQHQLTLSPGVICARVRWVWSPRAGSPPCDEVKPVCRDTSCHSFDPSCLILSTLDDTRTIYYSDYQSK